MNKNAHSGAIEVPRTAIAPEPARTYFARMWVYLGEMYPLSSRLVSSLLFCFSFGIFLYRVHDLPVSVSRYLIIGTCSSFLLLLILRLMDELKDREIDRQLFCERPLPSGKVRERDIRVSLGVSVAVYLFANLWIGRTLWAALFVLLYALLMFKYFFIPDLLRRKLLLNLATHNPIVAWMLLYLVVLWAEQSDLVLGSLNWPPLLPLIAMYWSMALAWEIARKIRCREEENAYVTYSQLFGRAGAVALVWSLQTTALGIGIYFYRELSLSWIFLAFVSAGYGTAFWAHLRFLLNPNLASSRLKPYAEVNMLAVFLGTIADWVVFG